MEGKVHIAIIILVNVLALMVSNIAQGALTNKNQTNDYLPDQIGNLSDVQEDLKEMLSNTKKQIKANAGNSPEGLDFITDQSASELDMNTQDLQSARASDLDVKGRDLVQDKEDIRDLHIDYSKAFNKRYKQSAKRLIKHYISQLEPLFSEMEEIGINCNLEKVQQT
jgi:Na+/phosphate symporter